MPQIIGNELIDNGLVGSTPIYTGIDLYNSVALLQDNSIQGSNFGIYCDTYSSPTSGQGEGSRGHNHIYLNNYGIIAYNGSNPDFGMTDGADIYIGTCNTISSNTYDNAMANVNSTLYAQVDYWGAVPPDVSKIHSYNNSNVYYSFWQTDQFVCPGGGEQQTLGGPPVTLQKTTSSSDFLVRARLAMLGKRFEEAESIYKDVISKSGNEGDVTRAFIGLYDLYRLTGNNSLIDIMVSHANDKDENGIVASELLAGMLSAKGDYAQSRQTALNLKSKHSGTEIERRALIHLASLGGFAETERVGALSSREELVSKFADLTDAGLLVALSERPRGMKKSQQTGNSATIEPRLSNFPNPFNPVTTISYRISQSGRVSLKVFDVVGREVATIVNSDKQEGTYIEKFDASHLSSGVYFYQLIAPGVNETRKMLIAK